MLHQKIDPSACEIIDLSKLPNLVLAVHERYPFTDHRPFIPIAHQTGGEACHWRYIIGTILRPRPEVTIKIQRISDSWQGSNCGAFSVSLDDILEYRKQLNELLGADCNHSYAAFAEGIYPIDCSPDVARRLTDEEMPDDFDATFIKWRGKPERFLGSLDRQERWHLYILGRNSL